MQKGDKALQGAGQWGQQRCDLLVVGGGVMGLWAALTAADAGLAVTIADRGRLGEGASHGHLGALMAHTPDKWNPKKQFQFDALVTLAPEVAALEARTGLSTGYRRSGRLIPLPKSHLRDIARKVEAEARINWQAGEAAYEWRVVDQPPSPGWPDSEGMEGGFVFDTFAAKASPRGVTAALIAALKVMANVTILEGREIAALNANERLATFSDWSIISFGHCVLAAGYQAFPMLQALLQQEDPLGKPVKGQSALLKADIDPDWPLIFLNGLYVIPHEGGQVAIGSTSENAFNDPFSTDELLEDLISRARELVPLLKDAPVLERWAGLRPRALSPDPLVGPVPGHEAIIALTGGFKVSFGIARRLAEAALQPVLGGEPVALPAGFQAKRLTDSK